ncbi:MAG: YlbF family regulator [Verrucomicrobia bacterium]|nr:YlbF family regulator [Verrucomicrobiota bacterium]
MSSAAQSPHVLKQARELCRVLAAHAGFAETRRKFDEFMANAELRMRYHIAGERGRLLEMKQAGGLELTDQELAEYHAERDTLMQEPLVRGFQEAQAEMSRVQELLNRYLTLTYELGRAPTDEEVLGHSCGPECEGEK